MAGRGIDCMPTPPDEFRPDVARCFAGRFETDEDGRSEDKERMKLLQKAAATASNSENREQALLLAAKLDYGDGPPPRSLASKLYMRQQRILWCGNTYQFAAQSGFAESATIHLEPSSLELSMAQLQTFHPASALASLLSSVNRVDRDLSGAAIINLDCEHEAGTDIIRFGYHGFVHGPLIEKFDLLRKTRNFQPRLPPGARRATPRVRICRELDDVPYHLTYLAKGSVYGRWEGIIDGRRVRSRKRRVPEPRHTQLLLWLDRWSFKDMCLLIGVRVGKNGFVRTRMKRADGP